MNNDTSAIDMTGAREVYKLLEELDRHINSQDASGRVLLYEAKQMELIRGTRFPVSRALGPVRDSEGGAR